MTRIFISYRRDDTRVFSARIHDRLVAAFGREAVFFDVDKNIPAGSHWQTVLQTRLNESDVLLVIIGAQWGRILNERASDEDWVRFEVEHGLKRADTLVIPVLVDEASVPQNLPASVQPLLDRQIFRVRHDPDFNRDIQQLISVIRAPQSNRRIGLLALIGASLVVLAGLFIWFNRPAAAPLTTAIEAAQSTITTNDAWQPFNHRFEDDETETPMVLVPAGCFTMGYEAGEFDERNGQEICMEPYWIDAYEVTNQRYGSTSLVPDCAGVANRFDQPRNCMSWFDADAYCQSRGGRLPTEVEWEYAARGPDELLYPWGDDFISENAVYADVSFETASVGSRPDGVSWVGAYDMAGNLAEWTNSGYIEPLPYDASDGREDPPGDIWDRVERGGAYRNAADRLRSSSREPIDPGEFSADVGFRCVRDL